MKKLDGNNFGILNEYDKPYGKHIVIVLRKEDGYVFCKYLSKALENWAELTALEEDFTTLDTFGLCINFDSNSLWVEEVAENKAKYRDEKDRPWQERIGYKTPISDWAWAHVTMANLAKKEN